MQTANPSQLSQGEGESGASLHIWERSENSTSRVEGSATITTDSVPCKAKLPGHQQKVRFSGSYRAKDIP